MSLGYREGGSWHETPLGPPQTQRWDKKKLITKQSRGCTCTLRLSSNLVLIIHAKVESLFLLSFVIRIFMLKGASIPQNHLDEFRTRDFFLFFLFFIFSNFD
jgi:hypothetical protein